MKKIHNTAQRLACFITINEKENSMDGIRDCDFCKNDCNHGRVDCPNFKLMSKKKLHKKAKEVYKQGLKQGANVVADYVREKKLEPWSVSVRFEDHVTNYRVIVSGEQDAYRHSLEEENKRLAKENAGLVERNNVLTGKYEKLINRLKNELSNATIDDESDKKKGDTRNLTVDLSKIRCICGSRVGIEHRGTETIYYCSSCPCRGDLLDII